MGEGVMVAAIESGLCVGGNVRVALLQSAMC